MSGFDFEVFRGPDPAARERALVLRAKGIQFGTAQGPAGSSLLVRAMDAQLALDELSEYESENVGWPPQERYPAVLSGAWIATLTWAATLFAFYGLQTTRGLGLNWWAAGSGRYDSLETLELWRTVTSLTLHVDLTHLLSNTVFGGLFILLSSQLLGPGLAFLSAIAAGAAGNLIALFLRTREGSSIGASTAVFAIIGILVSLEWLRRRRLHANSDSTAGRMRRWAPILMGAVFLGHLGASGERTDFLAHATGLLAGFLAGFLLPVPDTEPGGRLTNPTLQIVFGASAAALILGAWAVAFV